uniref:hypothetical protein n=1 Tax=Herbaspirillum sp. RV1423 TaxID=1443993 RepID=UPI0005572A96
KWRGAITPITEWLLYAANPVAPLRRQSGGALTPITEWLLNGENSHSPAAEMNTKIDETTIKARVDMLTQVIAEMKVAKFEKELDFLEKSKRVPLLNDIRSGETLQYEDRQQRTIMLKKSND